MADHLGWFDDHSVTIETIMKEKGINITKITAKPAGHIATRHSAATLTPTTATDAVSGGATNHQTINGDGTIEIVQTT